MNIQRELHDKERQDTRAAIGEHKQRELPIIGGNNCPQITLSFNELFDTKNKETGQ
jgi:hypothetical protein